jgi:taurine dioxygenase
MEYAHIDVQRYGGGLGAGVGGVDLSAPLGPALVGEIRRAWLEHMVLFFRDQALAPEEQLRFARHFGSSMERLPFIRTLPDHDEVQVTSTNPARRPELFTDWHTDVTWKPVPTLGTVLCCIETPAGCGDTMWSNQCAAFDALSPAMQSWLTGLTAVHDPLKPQLHPPADGRALAGLAKARESMPPVEHPLVARHPETGRSILYVNRLFTSHVTQLARAESDAVLAFLFTHCERPEFQCRLQWAPGTVAFWDNRCTMHKVIDDFWPRARRMHRVAINGAEAPRPA